MAHNVDTEKGHGSTLDPPESWGWIVLRRQNA